MRLKDRHIIKCGGKYYIDRFNVKWIDYKPINGRSLLRFFNSGNMFNVYVMPIDMGYNIHSPMVQFTTIKSWWKFKLLIYIFNL